MLCGFDSDILWVTKELGVDMKNTLSRTVILVLALFFFSNGALAKSNSIDANGLKGKILVVVSNVSNMGDKEAHDARNNLLEVAPPFHIFVSHGFQVDFVSPNGGPVEFSMNPMGISSYAIKYENFLGKTNATLTPKQVKAETYDAVFIGGGYGPLFDVANNQEILSIIAKIYENGGVVGGCGHGPGSFANVKLMDGQYMVKGKKIAGFPNSTEKTKSWAKQGKLLPFFLEDKLRDNGAIIINKENIEDKHDVIVDRRIVSTMFLPSSALVAKEMLLLLSR